MMKDAGAPLLPEKRGHEHGSYIIEGLETGRVYRGHFNVVNNGCITNLPNDAIVEVPGYVDRNGVSIPRVGDLPLGCAAVCNASISVQRLAVEAAVHGDVTLLKQAMMMDPLTGAVCDPEEISQMTDEMLVAGAKWLPQYKREIPKAAARLADAKRRRTYRGTNKTKGAARLPVKTTPQSADAWAREAKAGVLQKYTATSLMPPLADIRKAAVPAAALFTRTLASHVQSGAAGFIDIRGIHDGRDGVVFLRTTHRASKAGAGRLVYGVDGPVRVWVNGRVADCRPTATNPANPGEYRARATWRKGSNEIVFALSSNRANAWGLYAAAG